ncbi:MAG: magnesium transporter, partial [Desulfuromonadales bacterium]|nr:magnesium transporter [Desulfuromonadales bacterium]
MDQRQQMFLETVRRLIRRGASPSLSNLLSKSHPADVAHLFHDLERREQRILFELIADPEMAATVLSELDPEVSAQLLENLNKAEIVTILDGMANDDAVDVIQNFPEGLAEEILQLMEDEASQELEQLLQYEEDTAGGIMSPDIFSLSEEMTVREAIGAIQQAEHVEMVFYLYVTDAHNHLVGVLSLRQLLTVAPEKLLGEVMARDVISVRTDVDQEEVARMVEKYNILAIPVVNETNKLMGVITVDDIIYVLRREATEDIYKMAGASDEELLLGYRSFKIARLRLPWLLTNLLGGVATGFLMWRFKVTLETVIALITFIPVITGMGGNVGAQSATIVVRGFATGRIDFSSIRRVIFRELRVGVLMGVVCGCVIGVIAYVWHGNVYLGLVVGIAMIFAITVAAAMGVIAPAFFKRIGIDPAIAAAPFVQTANDITG